LDRRGLRRNRFVELVQPAANLVAGVRRQAGKLERRNMAAVVEAKNNGFPINPGRRIQRKRERNFFGWPEGHHRSQRKPVLGEIAHHSAVGGRKFDVDEA
jgi:hypothetical protein